ncbi:hypothetical protein [Desulfatirhabdium butyrativorans]|uniref:hypothetical protein n=1 Tax=Desulfatirhabdium butyrativorans TaxID=340467 RepID=UPI000401616C|nr:hypothetical protein [Desulfatirhabdium butyrativorans]
MKEQHPDDWITLDEAAEIIGCKRRAVYQYKAAGLLRFMIPDGKREAIYCREDAFKTKAFRNDPNKARLAAKKRKPVEKTAYRIEAICPKCGIKHATNRRWIGRGTPRFYCQKCQCTASSWSSMWQNQAMAI